MIFAFDWILFSIEFDIVLTYIGASQWINEGTERRRDWVIAYTDVHCICIRRHNERRSMGRLKAQKLTKRLANCARICINEIKSAKYSRHLYLVTHAVLSLTRADRIWKKHMPGVSTFSIFHRLCIISMSDAHWRFTVNSIGHRRQQRQKCYFNNKKKKKKIKRIVYTWA